MTIIATIEPLIGGLIQEENRHYLANSPAIEPLIGGLKCSFAFLERGAVEEVFTGVECGE